MILNILIITKGVIYMIQNMVEYYKIGNQVDLSKNWYLMYGATIQLVLKMFLFQLVYLT